MASPLKAFRKYQRQMLVFFGVLLMIAFILGGVISTNFAPPSERESAGRKMAVSWDNGHYDQVELLRFRNGHQITQRFLYELYMQARSKGVDVRVDPNLMPAGSRSADNYYGELIILLMADEAKRMGVVVGEMAVEEFLNDVGGNEFLEGDYIELLRQVSGGGFSYPQLKLQLETELAALRMQDFLLSGIGAMRAGINPQTGVLERQMRDPYVTPVAAVAAERMTNDTVKVQMVPIDVAPYVDQIKESPSRSEMRRLYAEAATKNPDLQMQRAGFRQPDRARVQWFEFSVDTLSGTVGRITDQEVQQEYDERVARRDLSVVDSSPLIPPGDETPLIPLDAPDGSTPETTTPETTTPETTTLRSLRATRSSYSC